MRKRVGISPLNSFVAVCTVVAILAFTPAAFAAPTTPQIEQKRREASVAQQKLDDLAAQLELRSEEYEEIEQALATTRERIAETRSDLEKAKSELAVAQAALSARAERIYRSGDVGFVDVLFGVRNFQSFLTLLDFMRQVARSDAAAVSSVKEAVARVQAAERMLDARQAEQAVLREQARVKRAEVQSAVRRQRGYLTNLNADIAKLVREERARQARIAAERARRAAVAAAAAAAARNRSRASAASQRHFDSGALGGGHPEVVAIGLQYVGIPYVWGGSAPEPGFDCSGLTQYVYAKAGIDIPRNSRTQFAAGVFIPPDRLDLLQPGDLVFFGIDADPGQVHHVGIYVGGGSFLHAPQTGENVQVSSLNERIATRADYVGGCRF